MFSSALAFSNKCLDMFLDTEMHLIIEAISAQNTELTCWIVKTDTSWVATVGKAFRPTSALYPYGGR